MPKLLNFKILDFLTIKFAEIKKSPFIFVYSVFNAIFAEIILKFYIMKKIFTSLAVAFFAANSFAQVITQSSSTTVTAATSVACTANDNSYTSDNYYSRAFKLSDYAINYDYKITKFQFGVESANTDFTVQAGIWKLNSGTYPTGPVTLLDAVDVPVSAANNLGLVDTGTDLNVVVPNGSTFVAEIFHDGNGLGQLFYMGANSGAQTGNSYLKSAGCSVNSPVTTQAIGFPNARWVMVITGENNLGVTEIINSRQLQIYPNPVKDVLNFKMDKGLNVESVELYDMTGKVIPMKTSKMATSVNVSTLAKGNYVLKVKADDGKVHIQKVIKD